MAIPIANLSAVVTGAIDAAKAIATEMQMMLPAAVTRDAFIEASKASVAWLTSHLWAWLAVAVDSLPAGATLPWLQTAAKLLSGLYGRLAAAVVQKLPDVAAERLLGDAAAWLARGGGGAAVYATTLAIVLLSVAFVGGAVCALTCRSMKGPGLGGARVPRAVFEASPKRYYAAVRTAKKAHRRASAGAGGAAAASASASACKLLPAGLLVAFAPT